MNEIVGHCPVCNAPIWGQRIMQPITYTSYGTSPQLVTYGCECRHALLARINAEAALFQAHAEAIKPNTLPTPQNDG